MATNILGVDYGHKRVGLALAMGGERPQRLMTLAGGEGLVGRLRKIITEREIGVVVLGLPRNLEGDDTPQTAAVRAFAAELQQAVPEVPVEMQDEAVTSELARERLGGHNSRTDGLVDQEAAVIILEDYVRSR